MSAAADLVCSARGCRALATQAVVWNNPKVHRPGRRKVWTTCEEHTEALRTYVDLRGFLIEVLPVEQLGPGDG